MELEAEEASLLPDPNCRRALHSAGFGLSSPCLLFWQSCRDACRGDAIRARNKGQISTLNRYRNKE